MRVRSVWAFLLVLGLGPFASGCKPLPTDPGELDTDGRTYVNRDWGFQVTIPSDSSWSWSAQTFFLVREPNGLPQVQVRISKQANSGTQFRPTLTLEPHALQQEISLDSLVTAREETLRRSFRNYISQQKETVQLGSEAGVEWVFRTFPVQDGDRFLSAVVKHRQSVYLILGGGVQGHFPVEAFKEIISTLRFLD